MAKLVPAADNKKKPVPAPVVLAHRALKILAREGHDTDELKKTLPGLAMRLSSKGEKVSVELLLTHAREGNMTVPAKAPPQKKTYADIVQKITAAKESKLFMAASTGNVAVLKNLSDELKAASDIYKMSYANWATFNGHFEALKYLVEEHGASVAKDDETALGYAVYSGKLEIVKYLADVLGKNIHADNEDALFTAAQLNHLDIVKYLVEEKGADIHILQGKLLYNAAVGGIDIVQYLVEKGLNPKNRYQMALRNAARYGHVDVVKYFAEKGSRTNTYDEAALCWAIAKGYVDIVKYLVEECGADITRKNHPVKAAIRNSRMDMLKYLVEEAGLDINANNSYALKLALKYRTNNPDAVIYLVREKSADLSRLTVREKNSLEECLTNHDKWLRIARTAAPNGVNNKNPGYFKPKVFQAIRTMVEDEKDNYVNAGKNRLSYMAAALFGSEDRVLQYLEKWGQSGEAPLLNLLNGTVLPANKIPAQNLASWADALVKCGPSMAKFIKFADKVPVPAKSSDGKTWSMVNTRALVAEFAYARAHENPELALLCVENGVDEKAFNRALTLAKKPPAVKNIPAITIDGKKFDMAGAKFYPLPANDLRGLFLGELVDCCQSIGKVGEKCAESGFKSEHEGFYVIENAKGRVIGQTWAWQAQDGGLVFDSLEGLGKQVSEEQWTKLCKAFARALSRKTDVNALHIGISGYADTPKGLQKVFKKATVSAQPIGRAPYRDSTTQIVVWKKRATAAGVTQHD